MGEIVSTGLSCDSSDDDIKDYVIDGWRFSDLCKVLYDHGGCVSIIEKSGKYADHYWVKFWFSGPPLDVHDMLSRLEFLQFAFVTSRWSEFKQTHNPVDKFELPIETFMGEILFRERETETRSPMEQWIVDHVPLRRPITFGDL